MYDDPLQSEGFGCAPSYASERYGQQIEELLVMMGRLDANVTDESQFFDFYSKSNSKWEELRSSLMENFDIEVNLDDYLWEAAEKIHKYES
tara:strand:+ start:89 stop:361 length:273 start_codon:yes stop_codon:yes gene_type:complete